MGQVFNVNGDELNFLIDDNKVISSLFQVASLDNYVMLCVIVKCVRARKEFNLCDEMEKVC